MQLHLSSKPVSIVCVGLLRCVPVLAALSLAACATVGTAPQDQVRQRANERWKALVAGEFSKAYNYSTAGYRAVVKPDDYRGRIGSAVKWVDADVVNVKCEDKTKCTATVRIEYKPILGGSVDGNFDTHVDEVWLYEEGNWSIFQALKP